MKVLQSILLSAIFTIVTAIFYYNLLPVDIAIVTIVSTFLMSSKCFHIILNKRWKIKDDGEILGSAVTAQMLLYTLIFGWCLVFEMPEWYSAVMFSVLWILLFVFFFFTFIIPLHYKK